MPEDTQHIRSSVQKLHLPALLSGPWYLLELAELGRG